MQKRIKTLRSDLDGNRHLWGQIVERGICSRSYLRYVVEGSLPNPLMLEALENFIARAR